MPTPVETDTDVTAPADTLKTSSPRGENTPHETEAALQRTPEPRAAGAVWPSVACACAMLGALGFVGSGLWQAGALMTGLMDATRRPPLQQRQAPALPAPAPPALASATAEPTPALPSAAAHPADAVLSSLAPREAGAEASEKAIPVGNAAWVDLEERLTIGEPPPSTSPRMPCDDVFVYIVSHAESAPLHSAASLGIGKRGRARFRQPGGRIGDYNVLAIEDDWTGLEPHVWLERDGRVCLAQLAGNPTRVHSALKPPAPPRAAARKKKRSKARRRR